MQPPIDAEAGRAASTRCAVCGKSRCSRLFEKNGYDVVRCDDCGMVFVAAVPEDAALHRLYRDPSYFAGSDYYLDYLAHEGNHRLLARAILDRVSEHRAPPGDWLDVGCAAGFLLDEACSRGWSVHGVELSPSMADCAKRRGIGVAVGTLEQVGMGSEAYDVLSFCDSLEHVADPIATLGEARRILRPRGVVVIHTPNVDSALARWLGSRWPHFTPPEHVQYFARSTLARALAAAGFVIEHAGTLGHWFSCEEVGVKLVPRARRLVRTLGAVLPRSVYVDVGDLFVVARRRAA